MDKAENNLPSFGLSNRAEFHRVVKHCVSRRCGWRRFFATKVQLAPWWHRVGLSISGVALLGLACTIVTGVTPPAIAIALFFGLLGCWSICVGMLGRGIPVVEFLRNRGVSLPSAAAEFEKSLEECGVLTDASGAAERMVRFVFCKN